MEDQKDSKTKKMQRMMKIWGNSSYWIAGKWLMIGKNCGFKWTNRNCLGIEGKWCCQHEISLQKVERSKLAVELRGWKYIIYPTLTGKFRKYSQPNSPNVQTELISPSHLQQSVDLTLHALGIHGKAQVSNDMVGSCRIAVLAEGAIRKAY